MPEPVPDRAAPLDDAFLAECDEETLAALGNERTWRWQAEAALRDERALADAIAADLLSEFSEQTCMRKPGFAAWRARRGSEPT